MQKYMPLKEGVSKSAPAALSVSVIPNGYKMDNTLDSNLNSEMETIDVSAVNSTTAAASKHYTNKTNMAKLQWWNAPTTRITLDQIAPSLFPATEASEALQFQTQESRENDNVFLSNAVSKHLQNNQTIGEQDSHQQHHHQHRLHHNHHRHPYHGHGPSEDGSISPLSKSASSSCYKLHHLAAASNDRISNNISITNQFSIEEDQDQTKQDSQLLLNDFLQSSHIEELISRILSSAFHR